MIHFNKTTKSHLNIKILVYICVNKKQVWKDTHLEKQSGSRVLVFPFHFIFYLETISNL